MSYDVRKTVSRYSFQIIIKYFRLSSSGGFTSLFSYREGRMYRYYVYDRP